MRLLSAVELSSLLQALLQTKFFTCIISHTTKTLLNLLTRLPKISWMYVSHKTIMIISYSKVKVFGAWPNSWSIALQFTFTAEQTAAAQRNCYKCAFAFLISNCLLPFGIIEHWWIVCIFAPYRAAMKQIALENHHWENCNYCWRLVLTVLGSQNVKLKDFI